MNPCSSTLASFSFAKRKRDSDSFDESRSKRPKNNVFVNYLFEDIGKSFVSHLKGALTRNGFTICDHTMLPVIGGGQDESSQLLKAIEESEIYAVVLSINYPYSVRCLDELVRIMDCLHKFKRRRVFPVFFNVNPSDVRSQQGSFEEAFREHENNVDPKRVQKWRQALKEAGNDFSLEFGSDEEKFLRKTIKLLMKMQNPQELFDVEHPVGIESRARDIISALRLSDQAPSIVAVFGISGSDFDVSCFIQDIHNYEYGGRNWKVHLQNDVISCLTGNDKFMGIHNDGAGKIKRLISGQKVLLVLDDVYRFEQLQALGIHSASFGCESRIIVTTRNKHSLGNLPYTLYNISLLDTKESFELFTRLTFGKDELVDKEFVDAIADHAGGLPLVLEVWSRHFTYHERKQWPRILQTLKRIPHEDIQKKLQLSYDSLTNRAKNLFLDIACFFLRMTPNIVFKVLQDEESGFFPDIEIQYLVDKGLIRSVWNCVTLHAAILDMGRELVRQEHPDEPGKRTRLIDHRDIVRVLRDYSGTDSVRSIQLCCNGQMEEVATVQFETFRKMSGLRFIQLSSSKLEWSSSSNDDMSACFSFKHLKYLEWLYFPCKSLDNFDMGNVVVIILYESKLEKLWDGAKSLKKLRILDIRSSSSVTKTGNFNGLENLEQLLLRNCLNLEELHNSVGCLQKLVKLDVSYCLGLKRFPWKMLGKLTSLQNLKFSYCSNIMKISHEVGSRKSVVHLKSSDETFYSISDSLCQLHQQRKINLSGNTNLESIPNLPPNIKKIKASGCKRLVNLPPNISQLQNMKVLILNECMKLSSKGFIKVTELRNLRKLQMRNCNLLQVSCEIGNLVSLQHLDLSRNPFSSLPESFSNLAELNDLYLYGCSKLRLLPPLPSQLTDIDATNCWSLDVMPFDSMQKAYIFRSEVFKETFIINELSINLTEANVPEWCSYQNEGEVLSCVAPMHYDKQICGVILCAILHMDVDQDPITIHPKMHNKSKETSHDHFRIMVFSGRFCMCVMFCPFDDTELVVEAGDTVILEFDNDDDNIDDNKVSRCGMRWVYEDDVLDSKLVISMFNDDELCSSPFEDDEDFLDDSFAS
ncbi:TMV resistance protein N [Artemisia annua]|uniref:TMV resistance protein N n=1 Tax=Artemisia annua TaxID=35608 RepID=A0A2U1P2P2_ARTAN|nr:TMV resistance protein N [Artemisia annua]